MKKSIILQSFICLLAVSCSVNELDMQVPISSEDEDIFYATLESDSEPDTKVYLDENIKILWDAADKISIFNKSTLNQQYEFDGATGVNAGTFHRVPNSYFGAGNDLGYICSIYPYQESATISNSGVLSLTLPAEQTYREESFGPGANTMVSITDDKLLKFKNVGGYLGLKFYGKNVSVSSIRLVGNRGEPLSGEATIQLPFDTEPVLDMASTAGKSILLNCEEPVQLGATKEEATIFWMVVPPTDFTDGFTLLVSNPDGDVFVKEAHIHLAINRNGVLRISPIKVDMNSDGLSIDVVESADQEKLPSKTNYDGRTITVTTPTLNRSHLMLNYEFTDGASLMVNGETIEPGVTPVDVTKPVTLTVRSDNYGKNYTLVGCNTGLPVVRITMDGFTLSDIEGKQKYQNSDGTWVDEREWMPVDGDNTKSATISVEYPDGRTALIDKDGHNCNIVNTQIKGRGNASWKYNKKPYALKLENKTSVLGMKNHKRWILLANWKDRTLLRNEAAFWLSRQVSEVIKSPSFPYSVHGQFVELEINGEYRGNYYLCEQIKIGDNRLEINEFSASDISGGYLMEIDNNYDEQYKFLSGFYYSGSVVDGLKYMFKEPDEDLPDDAYNYMKNYIQTMETLIKAIPNGNYGYRDYIDMDSAIWFMFINELTGNGDFFNTDGSVGTTWYGPHSTYMYKDRDKADGTRSKLFMGPVWDFDYLTFYNKSGRPTRSNKWVGVAERNYYYYYFTQDPTFRSRTFTLWDTYKPIVESAMLNHIEDMKNYLILSEEFNTEKWGWSGTDQGQNGDNGDSFTSAVSKMKTAFTTKLNFMDGRITENATASNYRN